MTPTPALVALPPPSSVQTYGDTRGEKIKLLKQLIWTYFWLLLAEGALRKWVLPSLANPLLIIRDPVILLIYAIAMRDGLFPSNNFIYAICGLAVVASLASVIAGGGTLLITVFGVRTDFLHLPLLFLLPEVMDRDDVQRIGKWLLLAALPMALLVVLQFRSSPEAWVNRGVGGSIGAQMEVGFGKIRPPGTFAFTTGLVSFLALVAAYVLNAQMRKEDPNARLALFAVPALAVMVGTSGSRSTLGCITILLIGVVLMCLRKPKLSGRGIKTFFVLGIAYALLSLWSEFRTGLSVHETRFTEGGGMVNGILLRILSDLSAPFYAAATAPALGVGLGMGTNAASGILYGDRIFLLAEGEWDRVVQESGAVIGFAFIALRLAILFYLLKQAYAALNRDDPLPMLLLLAAAPALLNGQFGVASTLGFAVFGGGLSLAAARRRSALEPLPDQPPLEPVRKVRGRSVYAEQLHGD